MKVFMQDAQERVANFAPDAELIAINGRGMLSDGTLDLSDGAGYLRRWDLSFWDATASPGNEPILLIYGAPELGAYPIVEDPSGAVSQQPLFDALSMIPDSDVAAASFEGATGCPALTGHEIDTFTWRHDAALGDILQVMLNDGTTWGVQIASDGSLTEWDACGI